MKKEKKKKNVNWCWAKIGPRPRPSRASGLWRVTDHKVERAGALRPGPWLKTACATRAGRRGKARARQSPHLGCPRWRGRRKLVGGFRLVRLMAWAWALREEGARHGSFGGAHGGDDSMMRWWEAAGAAAFGNEKGHMVGASGRGGSCRSKAKCGQWGAEEIAREDDRGWCSPRRGGGGLAKSAEVEHFLMLGAFEEDAGEEVLDGGKLTGERFACARLNWKGGRWWSHTDAVTLRGRRNGGGGGVRRTMATWRRKRGEAQERQAWATCGRWRRLSAAREQGSREGRAWGWHVGQPGGGAWLSMGEGVGMWAVR
jgi:hypothetical protein